MIWGPNDQTKLNDAYAALLRQGLAADDAIRRLRVEHGMGMLFLARAVADVTAVDRPTAMRQVVRAFADLRERGLL